MPLHDKACVSSSVVRGEAISDTHTHTPLAFLITSDKTYTDTHTHTHIAFCLSKRKKERQKIGTSTPIKSCVCTLKYMYLFLKYTIFCTLTKWSVRKKVRPPHQSVHLYLKINTLVPLIHKNNEKKLLSVKNTHYIR